MNQASYPQPPQQQPPPPAKRMPTWLIVLLAIFGVMFVVVPILAVIAISGVRKYIANAKTAEARNALGQIAKDAASTYDPKRGFCPSATRPVPATMSSVSGVKYQSSAADWGVDKAQNGGFACLKFSLEEPQYFQYSYHATKFGFEAVAHGDLNGNGVVSTFQVRGEVKGGEVVVAPTIQEENPTE
jgi:type IV pilus assembly protein PilA